MNSLQIISRAQLRVLAAAAALSCAAVAIPAAACPADDQPIQDAFAVAEGADLSYLPFTLGEAQDEYASLTDRASDQPADEPGEAIVLARSFDFD